MLNYRPLAGLTDFARVILVATGLIGRDRDRCVFRISGSSKKARREQALHAMLDVQRLHLLQRFDGIAFCPP